MLWFLRSGIVEDKRSILNRELDFNILRVGTNNIINITSRDIFKKHIQLSFFKNYKTTISQQEPRSDSGKKRRKYINYMSFFVK